MTTAAPVIDVAFLDWAETVQERVEKIRGRIFRMAGGSGRHHRVQFATCVELFTRLSGPCRVLNSEHKLAVPEYDSYLMPDAMIACPPRWISEKHGLLDNPTVVIEVLSPSTESYDLRVKLELYARVETVREIVFLDSTSIGGQVYHRTSGDEELSVTLLRGAKAVLPLASVGLEIPFERIYAGLDYPPDGRESAADEE